MAVSRAPIPSSVRRRVLFNGRCVYCGIDETDLVIDHVIPHSRGGTDAEWNLAPACRPCNTEKGDLTPEEWRTWRERAGLSWPVNWSADAEPGDWVDDESPFGPAPSAPRPVANWEELRSFLGSPFREPEQLRCPDPGCTCHFDRGKEMCPRCGLHVSYGASGQCMKCWQGTGPLADEEVTS